MSIDSVPRRPVHCVDADDQSDVFTLIWLDKNCRNDHQDTLRTKLMLKEINNNCLFYDNLKQFRDHLEKNYFFETKTLLITSGSYVEKLLKDVDIKDKLPLLIIFCHDQNKYEKYSNSNKVTRICNDHQSLKTSIEHLLPSLKFHLYENRRLNSILSLKIASYENTNTLYSYLLFIEILKQTSNMDEAKDSMIKQVKNFYQNNSKELLKIEAFDRGYKAEDAIDWYTRDSFVYRLVNQAFRTDDSAIWYTFRFYISDLCKQLENVHRKQKINGCFVVYRGQSHVPIQEFNNMIFNCGGLIATNGFLSTSRSFDTAKRFISGAKDTKEYRVVIFEILVNSNDLKHAVFVDVAQCVRNSNEEEILFTFGTVFQIDGYEKEEDFWRIRMHVTDECINEIRQRMQSIQSKFSRINLNLFFGKLLIDMHQYDRAKSYFNMILKNLLQSDHQDRCLIYEYLGDLQMRVKNYNEALKYFQKSSELKGKDHSNMFRIYNHFGNYYKAIDDLQTAEEFYKKTLNYQTNSLINIGITKLNLSMIYLAEKKYSEAQQMCLDAREIFDEFQPISSRDILICQGILGDIHFQQEEFEIAESFYFVAFEMGKQILSIGDPRLIQSIYALADLYYKQDQRTTRAIQFCQEQLAIHEKYLSNTKHISIGQILFKIADLSNDVSYYQKAMEIFNQNKRLDYLSTAKCLIKLAEFNENLSFYRQALDIYRQIYPSKHTILIKTENDLKIFEQKPIGEETLLINDQIHQ